MGVSALIGGISAVVTGRARSRDIVKYSILWREEGRSRKPF